MTHPPPPQKGAHPMLRLTRHVEEKVVIVLPDGRRGKLWLTDHRRGRSDIVFEFPSDVGIWREELLSDDPRNPNGKERNGRSETR